MRFDAFRDRDARDDVRVRADALQVALVDPGRCGCSGAAVLDQRYEVVLLDRADSCSATRTRSTVRVRAARLPWGSQRL
jgi:hypothetical protein